MCTVTFIPTGDKYFFSSNRDERNSRSRAIIPSVYVVNGKKLIFPKDGDAGGSWIALHENGNAAVLLNGAFERHTPLPPYTRSRGLVFLDLITPDKPLDDFQRFGLGGIEPFTLVLLEAQQLFECRWDGTKKYIRPLNMHQAYVWSSVTLYEPAIIKKREQWFTSFLDRKPNPTQKDILAFHRFAGEGDPGTDLLMERPSYSTVSITSMLLTADRGSMKYLDMKTNILSERKIEFVKAGALI